MATAELQSWSGAASAHYDTTGRLQGVNPRCPARARSLTGERPVRSSEGKDRDGVVLNERLYYPLRARQTPYQRALRPVLRCLDRFRVRDRAGDPRLGVSRPESSNLERALPGTRASFPRVLPGSLELVVGRRPACRCRPPVLGGHHRANRSSPRSDGSGGRDGKTPGVSSEPHLHTLFAGFSCRDCPEHVLGARRLAQIFPSRHPAVSRR